MEILSTNAKVIYDLFCIPVIVTIIVYYIYNFVHQIQSYPRGPFPLPIIGNILLFRTPKNDVPPVYKFIEIAKQYGQMFTLWIGPTPLIVINNYDLHHRATIVNRNDFIDRADTIINKIFSAGYKNIFASSGPSWEALKKVGHMAARKFANHKNLPNIINDSMDETIDLMLKENSHFNPILFIDLMIYNIIAATAYGKRYSMDDKEFLNAKRVNDEFYENLGNGLISDFMPILRPFYYHRELKAWDSMTVSVNITKTHFLEHKRTYKEGIIRDFTDCVLEAKEEALKENSDRLKYYSDDNLVMVVSDLFQAGTDTTQTTMRWALLLLSNYPDIQNRIYEEIRDNIGDRNPTQNDIQSLPFTFAFICEVLRYRPPAPVGLESSASLDTQLDGFQIKKNTRIIFNLYAENNDPNYWDEPEKFNPNRFLDPITGQLIKDRHKSYVTFGLGRRACPGEKLALHNAFIMIARLIQRTRLELATSSYSADLVPQNILVGLFPKDYEIKCFSRIN